jgi:3-oxoadipate enol-lactonase
MHITINGIETRYILDDDGNSSWMTFLHPLGADLSLWDQHAGYFRSHYTVMRYDARGHGQTGVPAAPFTMEDLAHDLAALLDALGATATHLVGVSMGGMIAQQFALMHPRRTLSLTLADTTSGYDDDARRLLRERAAQVRREGLAPQVDATLARWFTDDYHRTHPEVIEQIAEVLGGTQPAGFAAACEAMAGFDVRQRLSQIAAPTLVVAGRHDTGTPVAMNRAIAQAIPGARFETIDAAHLAPIEQSRRFAALLESFLRELVQSVDSERQSQ